MQCRHIFYINAKYFFKDNQFDANVIAPRWKKNFDASSVTLINNPDLTPIRIPIIDSVEVLSNNDTDNSTAFNERLRFLQNLANIACKGSIEDRNYKWSILKNLKDMWSSNILVEIKAINTNNNDDLNVSGLLEDNTIEDDVSSSSNSQSGSSNSQSGSSNSQSGSSNSQSSSSNSQSGSSNSQSSSSNSQSGSSNSQSGSSNSQSGSSNSQSSSSNSQASTEESTIKDSYKLCSANTERGRPSTTKVKRARVIGLKRKNQTSQPLQIENEISTISEEEEPATTPSILLTCKRKKEATNKSRAKKPRLTIKLRDNITTVLDFVLINSDKKIIENIINNQMLIDEEHIEVTATVPSQIIDLYKEIKDKYDFAQFFTNDGISQLKALFKDHF